MTMKKTLFSIIIALTSTLLLNSCGVGTYSVTSGKSDEAGISFTSAKAMDITVIIDESSYDICTVKDKAYKADRKIKQTANNTIQIKPGTYNIKVVVEGTEVFAKKLFISASEHRIIEL
ncbi:MAG TPA: hypothetical protein DDW70_06240 [Rikenellaceae bacterium]|jgi:hypothetical protein|nr:hypothetical protein [Rikenellaceae bacterium]